MTRGGSRLSQARAKAPVSKPPGERGQARSVALRPLVPAATYPPSSACRPARTAATQLPSPLSTAGAESVSAARRDAIREDLLALSEHDRIDPQHELVEQLGVDQGVREVDASDDVDLAVRVAQRVDGREHVGPELCRALPLDRRGPSRGDVLRNAVELLARSGCPRPRGSSASRPRRCRTSAGRAGARRGSRSRP